MVPEMCCYLTHLERFMPLTEIILEKRSYPLSDHSGVGLCRLGLPVCVYGGIDREDCEGGNKESQSRVLAWAIEVSLAANNFQFRKSLAV